MQQKGAGGEKVVVHLSDGSSFVLHAEACARAGLYEGLPVDTQLRDRLLHESELLFARGTALRLFARAPQTRRGLARKLSARGYGGDAVRAALSRMEELGYLDDRAFAEAWVRSRLAGRPEGWMSLYRGLIGRGVSRDIAEEALGKLFGPDEELAAAQKLARGLGSTAAARKLQGRGFRTRAIAVVIRELRGRGDEDPAV